MALERIIEKDILDIMLLIKDPRIIDIVGTTTVLEKAYEIRRSDSDTKNYYADVLKTTSQYVKLFDAGMLSQLNALIYVSKFSDEKLKYITSAYVDILGTPENGIPEGNIRSKLLLIALSGSAKEFGVERLKQEKYFMQYRCWIDTMAKLDWKEAEPFFIEGIRCNKIRFCDVYFWHKQVILTRTIT